jgi:hypothetical protein
MLDTVYEYDALERVVATDSLPADWRVFTSRAY